MPINFSPSINIIRDAHKQFDYIRTDNAQQIFRQIANDYKIGIHAFNIIGSYGTGKSAFLLAFMQSLSRQQNHFGVNGQFGAITQFEFLTIVGDYESLLDTFARQFDLSTTEQILAELERRYQAIAQKQACWVIAIDEFGKYLEYAARNHPEREMYFVQQLAEYVNDESKNILLITTLHQGFDSYSYALNQTQREEWEKVKGRLKELTFNEPVEQLLKLAAEYIHKSDYAISPEANSQVLVTLVNQSRTFPGYRDLTVEFAKQLLPFDPIAAYVLTLSLQKYGQNQRSLFTFLRANDRYGINDYQAHQAPHYNLVWVYDYLLHNYYSFLSTVYNPHYTEWAAIKGAIERVEATFEGNIVPAINLVKVIGLLNIFAPEGARINDWFLSEYARHSLGMLDITDIMAELKARKIIRFVRFKQTFILFEGTDLNIELAVLEASQNIDPIRNVVTTLKKYFDFPYILAKAVTYKYGTPRFFQFQLSDKPIDKTPEDAVDGFINLVFSEKMSLEDLQTVSANTEEAILYGWYRHTKAIRDILFEIEKINWVMTTHRDDQVAVRQLEDLRDYHTEELNRQVLHSLYRPGDNLVWLFKGQPLDITTQFAFNHQLSQICEQVYSETPIFKNELINRHDLSNAISVARTFFIRALVNDWTKENLGFEPDSFPSQKTIYLTLLQQTGIHRPIEGAYGLDKPLDPSFQKLWERCEAFLDSAKVIRRNLKDLVDILSVKPFKLKQGVIDFWLITFIFANRDAFALYHKQIYVPEIFAETVDLVRKEPHHFQLKAFDVAGIKLEFFNRCRAFLQQQESEQFTNSTFIETIKPFLTFYHSLPSYTKHTNRLPENALRLREAIAKSTDPEKTFFEEFPRALGYVNLDYNKIDDATLEEYITKLRTSIKELRLCFDGLVDRIEAHLLHELGCPDQQFPAYRELIKQRFQGLKEHLLLHQQKVFHMRLMSELDDRTAWLSSLVQAVLKKELSQMRDKEELVATDKLSQAIQELDALCQIKEVEVNPAEETVVKVNIVSFEKGTQEQMVRLPVQKKTEVDELVEKIKLQLSPDRAVNRAALIRVLQGVEL